MSATFALQLPKVKEGILRTVVDISQKLLEEGGNNRKAHEETQQLQARLGTVLDKIASNSQQLGIMLAQKVTEERQRTKQQEAKF